jgi:hypothetical protein
VAFGLKGMRRSWTPDIVVVEGSFIVNGTPAITTIRPHNASGFTLTRKAAGVYLCKLDQAFASVLRASATLGPATGIGTGSIPTAPPATAMISQDFMTTNSGGSAYAADATGTVLVISVTNSGSLTELPSNYRLAFEVVAAENPTFA